MALDYGSRYYKLAGVKECIYHPRLPTFRRMDMDTAAHKLPDQHCRTTTPCNRGNFSNRAVSMQLRKSDTLKQTYPSFGSHWRYRNLYSYRIDDQDLGDNDETTAKQPAVEGCSGEKINTASIGARILQTGQNPWKFMLRQEPFIDHIGQRPIPATTFSRYRSTSSFYGGQVSSKSWKP